MAQIDSLFQFLISQGGHELLVPADDNCQIVDASGMRPLNRVMSAREVEDLLREVLPESAAAAWAAGEPVEFLRRAEAGQFRVRAERREEGPRLWLERTPADYVERLARVARDAGAGELVLTEGSPAFARCEGAFSPLAGAEPMPVGMLQEYLGQAAPAAPDGLLARFVVSLEGVGRARVAHIQGENGATAVFRLLPDEAALPADLPGTFRELLFQRSGLVLAAAPAGQGLTRLLAGLLRIVAEEAPAHIVSIEDLVEVPVAAGKALLVRCPLGASGDRPAAIRAAAALHPDVLFVDEILDVPTLRQCLDAARAGALVVGGCRGETVSVAVARLVSRAAPEERPELRERLAEALRGAVAQVLCRGTDGKLLAAREVLICMPTSADSIRSGRLDEVDDGIRAVGFSLDDVLARQVTEGTLSLPDADAASVDRKFLREQVALRARRESARH